jgi:hypothetical protein
MLPSFRNLPSNNPARKGELAASKQLFGAYNRFAVAPVFTRFEALEFFVWDAHSAPDGEAPPVIRQAASLEEALAGLPLDGEGE